MTEITADELPPVIVRVNTHGGTCAELASHVMLKAERAENPNDRREAASDATCSAELSLTPGPWIIWGEGVKLFVPTRTVTIQPDTREVVVDGWPTAVVRGEVAVPRGESDPQEIEIRWQPFGDTAPDDPPAGAISCAIAERRFACNVPASRFDVMARVRTYVSHFARDLELKPGSEHDLGKLVLKHGGSLLGRVAGPEKSALEKVTVSVTPVSADDPGLSRRQTLRTRPDSKGRFYLEALAPGEYLVEARKDANVSVRERVVLRENAQAELLRPLLLHPPRNLDVWISPPLSPEGTPWQVQLSRYRENGRGTDPAAPAGTSDALGHVRWQELLPGKFSVSVGTGPSSSLAAHDVELRDGDEMLSVVIPQTHVRGRVHLGGEGIAAAVIVGGVQRSPSVRLTSDVSGTFEGTVPFEPDGEWIVSVESRKPSIRKTLKIKPERVEGSEVAHLDVELPGTRLTGTVVDDSGAPVPRTIVTVMADDAGGVMQLAADESGAFELAGATFGTYELQTEDRQGRQSAVVRAVLSEEQPKAEVQLVVRSKGRITGRVVSPFGPVPGAAVHAVPTDQEFLHTVAVVTNTEGAFELSLPAGTTAIDVTVSAPGFATKMMHVDGARNGLTIAIDQNGGAVELEIPQFGDDVAALHPVLVTRGAAIFVQGIPGVQFVAGEAAGNLRATHSFLAPGEYRLCLASIRELPQLRAGGGGRCSRGNLAPFGTLRLSTEPAPR